MDSEFRIAVIIFGLVLLGLIIYVIGIARGKIIANKKWIDSADNGPVKIDNKWYYVFLPIEQSKYDEEEGSDEYTSRWGSGNNE